MGIVKEQGMMAKQGDDVRAEGWWQSIHLNGSVARSMHPVAITFYDQLVL